VTDERKGADVYASLREHWDLDIRRMAAYLAYETEDIDGVTHGVAKQDGPVRS
jgi:hypothetical protein